MNPIPTEIPLFPLRTVLFPGMPLPLHIFEERYKVMIKECMASNSPFGVVLIKDGEPPGESSTYEVGTTAVIANVSDVSKDTFDIVTVGYQRFKILSLLHDRPFLKALVDYIPHQEEDSKISHTRAAELLPFLKQYVTLISELTETRIELNELPDKPILLALMTAILLQVPLIDKQRLLTLETIPEMLALEKAILMREKLLLKAKIGAEYTAIKFDTFSAN